MADDNEHGRRIEYRKLRSQGVEDNIAKEKVWPSTSAGLKINADEKAKVESDKAAKEKPDAKEAKG